MNDLRKLIRKNIVPIIAAVLAVFGYATWSENIKSAEPYINTVLDATVSKEQTQSVKGAWSLVRVSDGDTIVISNGEKEEKIRLLGIDAPEKSKNGHPDDCYAHESTVALETMLGSGSIRIETDPTQSERDRYGRIIAYVYSSDDILVNKRLLEQGYVRELKVGTAYLKRDDFLRAKEIARQGNKGLWNTAICPLELVS